MRMFICVTRFDIPDGVLQSLDLKPNTSLRVPSLEPGGQSSYLNTMVVVPGQTVTNADGQYVSGSKQTYPLSDLVENGDVGDAFTTMASEFGLVAYLRNVIDDDGDFISSDTANDVAHAIFTRMVQGLSLTSSDLADIVESEISGDANFNGDILDLMRILSGEIYVVPQYTVIADDDSQWMSVEDRLGWIDSEATDPSVWSSSGRFLTFGEPGFVQKPVLYPNDAAMVSLEIGALSVMKSDAFSYVNPLLTYGPGGNAYYPTGDVVPVGGAGRAIVVYDQFGNVL